MGLMPFAKGGGKGRFTYSEHGKLGERAILSLDGVDVARNLIGDARGRELAEELPKVLLLLLRVGRVPERYIRSGLSSARLQILH